jgi:hypothetical protein
MADGVEADMTFRNAVTLEMRRCEMVVGREDRLSIHTSAHSRGRRAVVNTTTVIQAEPRTPTLQAISACFVQNPITTKEQNATPRVPAVHVVSLPVANLSTLPPGFVVLCFLHHFP